MRAALPVSLRTATVMLGATALTIAGSHPVFALDLTGTWTATTHCRSFFEGAKITFSDASQVQITQNGDAIGLRADYGGGEVDFYIGRIHPDGKKPEEKGELALIACGTDSVAGNHPDFDELGRFTAAAKPEKVRATLSGLSYFSDPGVTSPEAGSCKWKLTRVDVGVTAVPTVCTAGAVLRHARVHRSSRSAATR